MVAEEEEGTNFEKNPKKMPSKMQLGAREGGSGNLSLREKKSTRVGEKKKKKGARKADAPKAGKKTTARKDKRSLQRGKGTFTRQRAAAGKKRGIAAP